MERSFRHRLLLANAGVVLVIALGAVTAIIALHTTKQQHAEARLIDRRLADVDRVRSDSRELAVSARRYVLGADLKEHQRVLAITYDMKRVRDRLNMRAAFAKGAVLEAELDGFIAALLNAMSFADDDPIVRVSRFEDELARIRAPLTRAFEAVISHERARRDRLRSAHALASYAQWGILIASLLGSLLAIWTTSRVLRKWPAMPLSVRRSEEVNGDREPSVLR